MAKQRKKSKASNHHSNQKTTRKAKTNWRRFFERSFYTLAVLAMVAVVMGAYHKNKQIEYDLSVVGNGTATVVQVQDPDCALCRRLKNNLDSVKGDFKSNVQFKTANLVQESGQRFSLRHNVQHVTLVFFNSRGQRVNTLEGVTPAADIRLALQALTEQS